MNVPRARREGLRAKETTDGRLAVYDEDAEQGHLLSPLCATVFHLADGTRTLADLTTAVRRTHSAVGTTAIRLALSELDAARLLDAPAEAGPAPWGGSPVPGRARRGVGADGAGPRRG